MDILVQIQDFFKNSQHSHKPCEWLRTHWAYPACTPPLQTALTSSHGRYRPTRQLHSEGYIRGCSTDPSAPALPRGEEEERMGADEERPETQTGRQRQTDRGKVTEREARLGCCCWKRLKEVTPNSNKEPQVSGRGAEQTSIMLVFSKANLLHH